MGKPYRCWTWPKLLLQESSKIGSVRQAELKPELPLRIKPRHVCLFVPGLLIVLAGVYFFVSRPLRPLRVALITELRLVYRGEAPVRMKFSRRDGMTQVYIPAGEFVMGSWREKDSRRQKAHPVYLKAYWIDQVEVTNAMYALCVAEGGCKPPASINPYFGRKAYADHPVVYVSWEKAQAYCHWVGGRLPTEAEWEKAARGVDGRRYPWGSAPPDNFLLNFNGVYGDPRPAYDYLPGASPYGLLNMAGNVREWVADWFDPDYYLVSPYENPQGPPSGETKSLRGGAYWDNAKQVQTFYRLSHDPTSPGQNRGFRCVEDVSE